MACHVLSLLAIFLDAVVIVIMLACRILKVGKGRNIFIAGFEFNNVKVIDGNMEKEDDIPTDFSHELLRVVRVANRCKR
jgi:hypothetical protein